jgi:hypothetical protein
MSLLSDFVTSEREKVPGAAPLEGLNPLFSVFVCCTFSWLTARLDFEKNGRVIFIFSFLVGNRLLEKCCLLMWMVGYSIGFEGGYVGLGF